MKLMKRIFVVFILICIVLISTSCSENDKLVLIKYENPADKSDAVKRKRTTYGFKYYNKYAKATVDAAT